MQDKLLGIETTGLYPTVSILIDGKIYEETSLEELNHLQSLAPMVETLLYKNSMSMDDINGILITNGPGSFTGIRIGLSFAKAISSALKVPVYTQSSLKMLAYQYIEKGHFICPMLDGRKGRVFSALYDNDFNIVIDEDLYAIEEFVPMLIEKAGSRELVFVGDGVFPNSDEIKKCEKFNIEDGFLKSSTLLEYFKRYSDTLDSNSIEANYMRKSEAEIQRSKR